MQCSVKSIEVRSFRLLRYGRAWLETCSGQKVQQTTVIETKHSLRQMKDRSDSTTVRNMKHRGWGDAVHHCNQLEDLFDIIYVLG